MGDQSLDDADRFLYVEIDVGASRGHADGDTLLRVAMADLGRQSNGSPRQSKPDRTRQYQ